MSDLGLKFLRSNESFCEGEEGVDEVCMLCKRMSVAGMG